jgi:TM2 domain-containing membrane protein YozV
MSELRRNWLKSKAVSVMFFYSAVVSSSLCAITLFLAIPGVAEFLNSSPLKIPTMILFAALVVMGIPSVVILCCGMAIFCAAVDRSPIAAKVFWFALFFVSGPIGSAVYYFDRYRGYIKRNRSSTTPEQKIMGG